MCARTKITLRYAYEICRNNGALVMRLEKDPRSLDRLSRSSSSPITTTYRVVYFHSRKIQAAIVLSIVFMWIIDGSSLFQVQVLSSANICSCLQSNIRGCSNSDQAVAVLWGVIKIMSFLLLMECYLRNLYHILHIHVYIMEQLVVDFV